MSVAQSVPVRIALGALAFIIGASFCFATPWHNKSTFYFVELLQVPWWVYGSLFLTASVTIVFAQTKPIGYFIGATIYSYFGLAAWLAVLGGIHGHWEYFSVPRWAQLPGKRSGSLFAASNLSTIAVVYWTSFFLALRDLRDSDREVLLP